MANITASFDAFMESLTQEERERIRSNQRAAVEGITPALRALIPASTPRKMCPRCKVPMTPRTPHELLGRFLPCAFGCDTCGATSDSSGGEP